MSVPARPGETFTATLEDAPAGLVGLTFAVRTTPERVAVAVTGSGITEALAGDASTYYSAERTLPSDLAPTDPEAGTGYEVVWDHASLAEPVTEDLVVRYLAVFEGDEIPEPADVAAFLNARLRDVGGDTSITNWTTTTRPTLAQVQRLIDLAAPLVLVEMGDLSDDTLICGAAQAGQIRAGVATLIALYTARTIESGFWPEEVVNAGRTAEEHWGALIDTLQPKLVQAARECALGDVVAGDESEGLSPYWSFTGVGDPTLTVSDTGTESIIVPTPLGRRW